MASLKERNDRLIQQAEDNNQPLPYHHFRTVNGIPYLLEEGWTLKGHYHHVDRPAKRTWKLIERNGQVKRVLTLEEWYLNGILHRADNPARRSWRVIEGELADPAVLIEEEWYLNGKLHCIDAPAMRKWKLQTNLQPYLSWEIWFLNGERHRQDAPAVRVWKNDNELIYLDSEGWFLKGQPHRTDGSAYKWWKDYDRAQPEQVPTEESWYLKGVKIHPRILRQPVRVIERWWKFHQQRRQTVIENLLWDSGMTVFPGFMGLLKEY